MGIKILGTGSSHPSKKITNFDFINIETSDEWIYSRTGIKSRYISTGESTSSLAQKACKEALTKANVQPNKIKLLICATMTPDGFTPCVASSILNELGIEKAMAFDINVACSGFVYALNIANSLLNVGEYALVVGAETLSKVLDFNDRNTCVLFGDGAGSVVIQKDTSDAVFYANSKTDIERILYANGLANSVNNQICDYKLKMNGKEVFKFALDSFADCFSDLCSKNISLDDIDLIIPHQANKRIILSACKKYNLSEEKFYLNLENYGNTSAASIAIALDEARKNGKLIEGMKVLLIGFGSGLSWGYCLLHI